MNRIALVLVSLAIVTTSCSSPVPEPPDTTVGLVDRPNRPSSAIPAAQPLVQFSACDEFLDYAIEHALELVGPYGLKGNFWDYPMLEAVDPRDAESGLISDSELAMDSVQGIDFSGTNVQEIGVDEPDIVKTDGQRIIILSEQTIFVVDTTGQNLKLLGKTKIQDLYVRDLFLVGDRIIAFGSMSSPAIIRSIEVSGNSYPSPISVAFELDISNGTPEILQTLAFDGTYTNARLVDNTVRIVLNSQPTGFVWEFPQGGGLKAEHEAEEKNREIIRNSTIENWVPYFVLKNIHGDVIDEGQLVDCDHAQHPKKFSGLDMLTVLSVDMSNGFRVADATGVLAQGHTVYASTKSLFVATQQWFNWRVFEENPEATQFEGVTTEIHQFDITDKQSTEYVASGNVRGFPLNQFAMSEHKGILRIATTSEPNWWSQEESESESMITLLKPIDGTLSQVGMIDGLGLGERIFSVRFIEDTAFVVTFRETDPLYTVDLSDPTEPAILGELKILGYSAYLHPLGNNLLLGVGQDANESGRIEGTQISIFDVSDLDNPKRTAQLTLAQDSNSLVEYDHRAFLYWKPENLVVIPVHFWNWEIQNSETDPRYEEENQEVFFGAIGLDVSNGAIREIGQIIHPGGHSDKGVWDYMSQIQRSLVIGNDLYTISMKGLLRTDLTTLEEEEFLHFWD